MQKLSRGTIRLIQEAINSAKNKGLTFNDRYILCQEICEIVDQKYSVRTLDYQLDRMNLTTTKKVLNAIDIFFYKYPKLLDEATDTSNLNLDEINE